MIKMDIISGFLGSGKTTLIKKFLEHYKDEKVVVIENEFGEIGIDSEIIKKDGLDIIELQNGCICCSMKLNFKESILKVIETFNPDRIIIEPTGVAVLSELLHIINNNEIKSNCMLNSLITVVDVVNYLDYIENFGEFFENQISNAHTIVLSKTNLVEINKLKEVINSLRVLNKSGNIIIKNWDELNIEDLSYKNKTTKIYRLDKSNKLLNTGSINIKGISSFSITDLKIHEMDNMIRVFEDFKSGIYGEILRAKGFLNCGLDKIIQVNYVNGNYEIEESNISTDSKLCVIGINLEKEKLVSILK